MYPILRYNTGICGCVRLCACARVHVCVCTLFLFQCDWNWRWIFGGSNILKVASIVSRSCRRPCLAECGDLNVNLCVAICSVVNPEVGTCTNYTQLCVNTRKARLPREWFPLTTFRSLLESQGRTTANKRIMYRDPPQIKAEQWRPQKNCFSISIKPVTSAQISQRT